MKIKPELKPGERVLPTGQIESVSERISFILDLFDDGEASWLEELKEMHKDAISTELKKQRAR